METLSGYPIRNAPYSSTVGPEHVFRTSQERILLEALASYVRPLTTTYATTPDLCNAQGQDSGLDSYAASQAGRQLLVALGQFIKVVIHSDQYLAPAPQDVPMDTNNFNDSSHSNTITPSPAISQSRSNYTKTDIHEPEGLSTSSLDLLRKRVFNQMPIRMLTYDSGGSNPKLVNRNEVLQICTINMSRMIEAHDGPHDEKTMGQFVEKSTRYAILSHEWIRKTPGDLEYRDWSSRHDSDKGQGYNKIRKFCKIAAHNYQINLAWADTVCINKDSSSELDESIRSMYKWYRNASVCITYLSQTSQASPMREMWQDTWFYRGWTLQELLAPTKIEFYNTDWTRYQNTERNIAEQIEKATTITAAELGHFRLGNHDEVPLSRRMQMAANRQVTREEDIAYSLMGILGVDISVAYGEGSQRAFFRLLRELVGSKKYVLDIFNCSFPKLAPSQQQIGGLIASSVEQYRWRSSSFTDKIDPSGSQLKFQPTEPIIITHLGVRVPLLLVPALFDKTSKAMVYQPRRNGSTFYGIVELPYPEKQTNAYAPKRKYHLLHRDIFDDGNRRPPTAVPEPNSYLNECPDVATFGIFNFGIDSNNYILIPSSCISIPLNCGNRVGDVSSSDKTSIIPNSVATVFSFANTYKSISKAQLADYGLQLVTLYL